MEQSNTHLVVVIAKVAATGMVVASAGFGAVYAYRVGAHGGTTLAGLTIMFAIALELIKPLAINSAFEACASWQFGRALSLSLLGALAGR